MAQRILQQIDRIPAWCLAGFMAVLFLSVTALSYTTGGIHPALNSAIFNEPPIQLALFEAGAAAELVAHVLLWVLVAVLLAAYRTPDMALLLALLSALPLAFALGAVVRLATVDPAFQGAFYLALMLALVLLITREMASGAYAEPSLVTGHATNHAASALKRGRQAWQWLAGGSGRLWLGGGVLAIGGALAAGVLPVQVTLWHLPGILVTAAVATALWLWRTTGLTVFAAYLLLPHVVALTFGAPGYGWPATGVPVPEITTIVSDLIVIGALQQGVSWTLLLVAVWCLLRESRRGYYGPVPGNGGAAAKRA